MDSNHPTPINEGEINKNDEPDDTATIKIEQKNPDYEAVHDSLRSEKVKIKVEGVSSTSTIEYVGIEDNKEAYDTALLTDKMEIKDETDVADYVVLKRIKDEPNIEQWDEDLTTEAVVQVKMEQQAAVAIKLEGVDTKTEDTDFKQLTEEVDIKPDEHLSQGDVDSALTSKRRKNGLGIGHKEAKKQSFISSSCNYIAPSNESLEKHITSSECRKKSKPSNVCVCTGCNKVFGTKSSLNNHLIKIHSELATSLSCQIYQCANCDFKDVVKANLRRHLLIHSSASYSYKPNKCLSCTATFKSKLALDDHLINIHPKFIESVKRKIYHCSSCTYKTVRKCKIDRHVLAHSGGVSNQELSKCKHCHMSFKTTQSLDNHIVKKHPDFIASVKRKILQCPSCAFKAVVKCKLDEHLLVHSNSKPSTCSYCSATFKTKQALDNHILRKHPNYITSVTRKVHQCPECGYKTVKKANLDNHIVVIHPNAAFRDI